MDFGTLGDSECSSGCESGWTLYLENSYIAPPQYHSCNDDDDDDENGNRFHKGKVGFSHQENQEEEEEDLSMVSDASSGPPQFIEEDDSGYGYGYANVNNALPVKRQRQKKTKRENRHDNHHHHPSALDDTASSPLFNLSNNPSVENVVLDFSQGYSTTHLQQQYGFFLPTLHPENQLLVQNQWFEGKKWG